MTLPPQVVGKSSQALSSQRGLSIGLFHAVNYFEAINRAEQSRGAATGETQPKIVVWQSCSERPFRGPAHSRTTLDDANPKLLRTPKLFDYSAIQATPWGSSEFIERVACSNQAGVTVNTIATKLGWILDQSSTAPTETVSYRLPSRSSHTSSEPPERAGVLRSPP